MKLRMLACTIALAAALLFTVSTALSQHKEDKAKGHEPSPAEMQEMMKKWMEFATPGAAHKFLDVFTGKWETSVRMWMAPDAQPMETKGSAETRWIMDGRYLLEEGSGQVMGMPFRNMLIAGYDNFKKKYVISYLDNLGTGIYGGEGDIDMQKKVMTSLGKMDDPMTGEKDKLVRYVTRLISKDKFVLEMYDLVGKPEEFKAVEITYTRKP